jgi:hypothetical protein
MKNACCTSGTSPTCNPNQPDFSVTVDAGSIFLLIPHSESARAWIEQNIGRDNGFQPWWPTVVIEHRYITDIVAGIRAEGLVVL